MATAKKSAPQVDVPDVGKAPPVTVTELQKLCAEACVLQDEIEEATAKWITPRATRLKEVQSKIQAHMEQSELEKFIVKGYGTFSVQSNFSVKVPGTEEHREAFFAYLKERGIFESMITVNSATLNAWYKQELAAIAAKAEAGEDVDPDFKIPGIEEPKDFNVLRFRKETKRG